MSSKKRDSGNKIIRAAAKIFGRFGYSKASMSKVAKEAGVSKGLLHYHFHSKERLLIEAQRSTFKQLHRRFVERASRGDKGLPSALDALDSMWESIRELQAGAPLLVETLSLAAQEGPLREKLLVFYKESTELLSDGIQLIFSNELDRLAIPPIRMANIIRILLEGLLFELAKAHSAEELAAVDQAYEDMRALFARFVITQPETQNIGSQDETFPLPW